MLCSRSLLVGSGLLAALSAAACSSDSLTTPGSTALQITTSTSGTEPDPDGYTIQVDGGAVQAIGASGSMQRTDLSAGDHTVQLAGLAPNCSLTGDNPRTVTVASGQTATVSFSVTCGATTGGLQVTSSTTGPSPDADGFTVTVDGIERGTLSATGVVNVDGLTAGSHVVGVSGVAANCQIQGDNPRSVTITPGTPGTVAFTVTCTTPPAGAGTLRVRTATTGADLDPDGYSLSVDGGKAQTIGVNGTALIGNIAGGSHSVKLAGAASNCTIQGTNPRSVNVSASTTVEAAFTITCGATSGTIKVTTVTTGSPVDPDGYTVTVDAGTPQAISVNAALTLASIAAGSHRVTLAGLASGCAVQEANPRSVTVAVGVETAVSFTVTCGSSGLQWAAIPLPPDFQALSLWASSPSDIFVVAGKRGAPSTAGRYVLRYDGHTWTEQFHGPDWTNSPNAIWGSSPTDVFVAGERHIWHYDGTQWLETPRELELYRGIWGSSPRDVYAVGVSDASLEAGLILHYDGTTWQSGGGGRGWYPGQAYDVAGTSANDVYVLGTEWAPPDAPPEFNYATSRLQHYDGNAWSTSFESQLDGGADDFNGNGVWAIAPNDAFMVGSIGRILHFNGTAWSPMTSPTSQHLVDVWGNSSSNVYAVGDGGILHYDGATWTIIKTTAGAQVWGAGTDVFVITTTGEILHGTP